MALVYAGIGSRKTPPETLQDMTTIAGWLAPQGWHLASGGGFGADTAFALGAPVAQRTIYLPEHGFNRLSGPDCLVPEPSDMEACIALAARLHPAWHKCSPFAKRAHGRNAAILLGPQLDAPVNAVIAWSPGGRPEGGTGMALRIAAEHGIEVMNLATMPPRAVCERLLDIRRGLSAAAQRPDAPANDRSPAEPIRVRRPAKPTPSEPVPAEPSHALERPYPGVGRNEHIDPGLLSPHPDTESRLQPLHGPPPDPDATRIESHHYRVDVRDAWDPHDAGAAVHAAYAALRDICPDGTPLASERQALAYGFVHALKSNAIRLWGRVDQQRYELDQAREVDRHLHDSLASETETLRASQADERAYANYLHSERGRADRSRQGLRRDPDAIARRGIACPGANPASPGVARSARDINAPRGGEDPDDTPDIAEGYKNLERRAHALDEITGIAAQCYQADFGEDWIAPRDPTAFAKPRSQDPSWVREQREKGDPRVRLDSWLTQWRILNQRAKNRSVPIAEMPAYSNMVAKAHDIAERDDADKLSPYEAKWLGDFLTLHPRPIPAPGTPDRGPRDADPSPRSPWDHDRAIAALHTLVDTLDRHVLANGTQLDDERQNILSSLGQWLYRERNRVEADIRRIEGRGNYAPESLRSSLAALTDLTNEMSEIHFRRTSTEWTPAEPPARERAKSIAAAELDARKIIDRHDYASARSKLVSGTYIAVSGSRHWTDAGAIHRALDAQRAQHPDMVLMHGGGPGAATIARSWASDRGVDQVVYLPQSNKYGRKAAPLRRNDEMLDDKPRLIVSFDCPGNPEPIAAEAAKRGIEVERFVDPALPARRLSPSAPRTPPPAAATPALSSDPSPPAAPDSVPTPSPVPHVPPTAAPEPSAPHTNAGPGPAPEHATPPARESLLSDSHPASPPGLAPEAAEAPASPPEPDVTQQIALCGRIREHEKARPSTEAVVDDGILYHHEETPAFKAWVEKARELVDQVPGFDEPGSSRFIVDLDKAAFDLHCDLPHDEPRDFIEALYDDIAGDLFLIKYQTDAPDPHHDLSWIYDPRTPDLLRKLDALSERINVETRTDATARLEDDLREIRTEYDVAMERREDLDRVNARLEQHLEDRQHIREQAAVARDATANHPDYEKWEDRLDDLEDDVSEILYDPATYGAHLAERPALASEIKSNLDLLTTAREGDLRLARILASPSPAPQHDPAIAEAPTLQPAPDRYPEPPPEPRHEPAPQIEDDGPSLGF